MCDGIGFLANLVGSRIYSALKSENTEPSVKYLGCIKEFFKTFLEEQLKEDINWNNHEKVLQMDHNILIKYLDPDIEAVQNYYDILILNHFALLRICLKVTNTLAKVLEVGFWYMLPDLDYQSTTYLEVF